MDFDALDLRQAVEKEYWVHLRLGDTLLFADMEKQERPCRVKTASVANPQVEEAMTAVTRACSVAEVLQARLAACSNRKERQSIEKRLDDAERFSEKAISRFLRSVILDWENIEKGGSSVEFSAEELKDMAEPKAPLYRLASTLIQDMGEAQDPFTKAESD